MKQIASIIVLSTLAAAAAFARIGDSEDQIQDRYGKPGPEADADALGHKTNEYLFKGYRIVVTFVNGQSEREEYYKEDESSLKNDDISAILALNVVEGASWKNTVSDKWKRSDDKVVAIFLDGFLDVITNGYRDALKGAQKKEDENRGKDDSSSGDDTPSRDDNPGENDHSSKNDDS